MSFKNKVADMDFVYMGIAAALLALLIGLVLGCDRLMKHGSRGSTQTGLQPSKADKQSEVQS